MKRNEIIKSLIVNGYKVIQVWERKCDCYELITDIHSINGQKYSLHRKFPHTTLKMAQHDLIAYEEERMLKCLYIEILKAAQ